VNAVGWEFPEELLHLQEEPHVMRRRTAEEEALTALSLESQRQHDVLQELLRLPIIAEALWYQGRVDAYERDGFYWASVRHGRSFKYVYSDGTWSTYMIREVYGEEGARPVRVRAWTKNGFTLTDREFSGEEFAARFGGWLDEG
jgi:hypothetical protein